MHEIAISFGVVFFFALYREKRDDIFCAMDFSVLFGRDFLSETGLVSMAMSRTNVFLKVDGNGEENCRF